MSLLSTSRPARRRAQFHPLTVDGVERLTDDAVAITFAVPESLREDYRFEPGQHLTLRASIDGRGGPAVLLDLPLPCRRRAHRHPAGRRGARRRRAGCRTG